MIVACLPPEPRDFQRIINGKLNSDDAAASLRWLRARDGADGVGFDSTDRQLSVRLQCYLQRVHSTQHAAQLGTSFRCCLRTSARTRYVRTMYKALRSAGGIRRPLPLLRKEK